MVLAAANIDVLITVAILLGVVLSGSLLILSLRKKVFAQAKTEADEGSLMEQMRAMESRGELSKEEFDRVRRKLVEKAAATPPTENDR
ncbi:MAG: hypothetical protein KF691_06250 [Phycisphaeraceae bacterium]|nr:hypothetical protein [Phycisphaeraceae bacterium]